MDIKDENLDILETGPHKNHAKRIEEASLAAEHFSVPGQENMKLETSSMSFLPLYRDDSKCTLLVLTDPQDKNRVLAIYLNNSWWLTEDVVKTSDPSREGLMQVQTFQERIVLFVLNCIIFGMLEGSLTHNTVFVPHPKKEHSKIFWRSGEAAAFYTIKKKGNLCDGHTSQCYMLPVLDTMFVRRKFRRCGLGIQMLQDFCQSFPSEDALGLSCPLSAEMEKVCQRFLEIYPKERSRLWEVEAPGDWTQRVNIWLKIQLEQTFPKNADVSCCMPKSQDGEAEQLEEGRMNTRVGCILPLGALPDEARACFDDSGEARESSPRSDEPLVQLKAEERKDLKKRMSRGEPAEGSVSKHFRTMS
ncbi:protein FAM169B isoform X2 [Python bivittatus]|nr:protein FAM169B isoform X2 [Python bivittatus]XP_025023262.1 protein FAM169B isoform X2 [Python bivittatus]XP_025023263.1 protein FAM169B isoform X2 [Python bivittatus]